MGYFSRAAAIYRDEGVVGFLANLARFLTQEVFLLPKYYGALLLSRLIGRRRDIWLIGNFASHDEFSENSKYLYLYLHNCRDDITPVWITKSPAVVDQLSTHGMTCYLYGSLKARYYTLQAGVVCISSHPNAHHWGYTAGATIIQLTHGIPLKGPRPSDIGNEELTERSLGKKLVDSLVLSTHSIDYLCVSSDACHTHLQQFAAQSENSLDVMTTAVRTAEPLVTGYPKTDILFGEHAGSMIGVPAAAEATITDIDDDTTVLGYFPTFREAEAPIDVFDQDRLEQFLREHELHLLYKPHREMDIGLTGSDVVSILPPETDMYPYLDVFDILVTDYSSIYFDYLLLDKPVIFYMYDRDAYDEWWGLHSDYAAVTAGEHATNFSELLLAIERAVNDDCHQANRNAVRDRFFAKADGNAAKRIVDQVTRR